MNYPETLTYEPDGIGLRWMVEQLPYWLGMLKRVRHPKIKEMQQAVMSIIVAAKEPLQVAEIYDLVPAEFRTQSNYHAISLFLSRQTAAKRIRRRGSMGSYAYSRREATPCL